MRGVISEMALDASTGSILGENGSRYAFNLLDWKELKPPQKGNPIFFIGTKNGTATDIYLDKTNSNTVSLNPSTSSSANPSNINTNSISSTSAYGYSHGSSDTATTVDDVYAAPTFEYIVKDDEDHFEEENYNIFDWFMKCMRNYANFSGRARRKEFWYFTLVEYIIYLIALALDSILSTEVIFLIISYLVFLLPSLAVTVRRFHDTSRSGWWCLIYFAPFGLIITIVMMALDTDPARNQWGAPAK